MADDVRLQFENDLGRVYDIIKEVCNQERRGGKGPRPFGLSHAHRKERF